MSTSKISTIYEFDYRGLTPEIKLEGNDLKGKVILAVSMDSNWGWTKGHYSQLSKLYTKYHEQGFEILHQPCNQWLDREPLDGKELFDWIQSEWSPPWPYILWKDDVKGKTGTPLFKFLRNHKNCKGTLTNDIKWNFTKFLIDRNGIPHSRYAPSTWPNGLENTIQKLLAEGAKM